MVAPNPVILMTRTIFALLSAIVVLVGIQWAAIRADALATSAEVSSLRVTLADVHARQEVDAEHARQIDESLTEIHRRLLVIDVKLTQISEAVAVLADRSRHTDAPVPTSLSATINERRGANR